MLLAREPEGTVEVARVVEALRGAAVQGLVVQILVATMLAPMDLLSLLLVVLALLRFVNRINSAVRFRGETLASNSQKLSQSALVVLVGQAVRVAQEALGKVERVVRGVQEALGKGGQAV